LREAFVIQYSGDALGKLRDELAEQVSEKARATIPSPPEMGTLDLTTVEQSEYFFA
jgi:DNA-directed RNA polymerase